MLVNFDVAVKCPECGSGEVIEPLDLDTANVGDCFYCEMCHYSWAQDGSDELFLIIEVVDESKEEKERLQGLLQTYGELCVG
jgi:hypothetical protein